MTRQQANLEILKLLGEYILNNPDQRFGQILRNISIIREAYDNDGESFEPRWLNGFYEESKETLERMNGRDEWNEILPSDEND